MNTTNKNAEPRLCGGLFLELILKALKPKATAEEHYNGVRDGLDDQSVLIELIKVADKDYLGLPSESFKTITSGYRNCKKATSTHLPFGDPAVVLAFDELVKNDYGTVLARMTKFVSTFIDIGKDSKRDVWLARSLIDFIRMDKSTDNEVFYCLENGKIIAVAELVGLKSVCLPALLLGIWHFIFMKRKENDANGWKIDFGTIGVTVENITVTMPLADSFKSTNKTGGNKPNNEYDNDVSAENSEFYEDSAAEQGEPYINEETADTGSAATNQIVNNGFLFQQFGNNNKQIVGNVGTLIINND